MTVSAKAHLPLPVTPVFREHPAGSLVTDDITYSEFRRQARAPRQGTSRGPTRSFDEVNPGLSLQDTRREAGRCFHCGRCTGCDLCRLMRPEVVAIAAPAPRHFQIDLAFCKRCGICLWACPRGVMTADGNVVAS
ncbi:MAG: 4Fe-4S binding protein [Candidatus Rokubacteria bacterium]|nr:4Fe-4S binding protein [Candidatus Rokubacteria bacterium]